MQTKIVDVVRLVDTNKAKLAFLTPLIVTVLGTIASWIVTGSFDTTEIRAAAAGVLLSVAGALGAYFGKPGPAEIKQ